MNNIVLSILLLLIIQYCVVAQNNNCVDPYGNGTQVQGGPGCGCLPGFVNDNTIKLCHRNCAIYPNTNGLNTSEYSYCYCLGVLHWNNDTLAC